MSSVRSVSLLRYVAVVLKATRYCPHLLRGRSCNAEISQAIEQVHPAHEARSQGVPSREHVERARVKRLSPEEGHGGRNFGVAPFLAENCEGSGLR